MHALWILHHVQKLFFGYNFLYNWTSIMTCKGLYLCCKRHLRFSIWPATRDHKHHSVRAYVVCGVNLAKSRRCPANVRFCKTIFRNGVKGWFCFVLCDVSKRVFSVRVWKCYPASVIYRASRSTQNFGDQASLFFVTQ